MSITCPGCSSLSVSTVWRDHHFNCGGAQLSASVPVRRCLSCTLEFQDDEAKDTIEETVRHHLHPPSADPREVITYGSYVGKDSIGAWIAFLAIYAGLHEADNGQLADDGCFRLRNGVIAKLRGSFEHEAMGWVPVFDFVCSGDAGLVWAHKIALYEDKQGLFLKALMCGEFDGSYL